MTMVLANSNTSQQTKQMNPVLLWLWGSVILVVCVIMLGGATRLTRSGLSITEWKPILGMIPPLNIDDWLNEFSKYQKTPEFLTVNAKITLSEFKFIYLMEYFHRVLARLIGFHILFGALYFWTKNKLNGFEKKVTVSLLVLTGLQGAMGWYMVKSGLVSDPHVSHYRLSAHLLIAFLIIAILLMAIFKRQCVTSKQHQQSYATKRWSALNLALVTITVFYGALVAGLKAGLIYNTFPLMEGQMIPFEWLDKTPLWTNFFENHATVQMLHRFLALSVLCMAVWGGIKKHTNYHFLIAVTVQVVLGICVLLYHVPVVLGTLHQGWAAIVFCAAMWQFLQSFQKTKT